MNNTIKQLAEEAGLGRDRWNSTAQFNDFLEDFASKIVRECTNMLPEDSVRDADGVHMFYVIRKHFGVLALGR